MTCALLLTACKGTKAEDGSRAMTGAAEASADAPFAANLPETTVNLERAVTIELYTDFVCPWCYIGVERLARLMETTVFTKPVEIIHRVYILDDTIPDEGVDMAERLRAKYGRDPAEMFGRVEDAARAADVPLDYSKITRSYPTIRAHALTHAAAERGTQNEVKQAIFRAGFQDGKNIADVDVLIAIGTAHGFQSDEVRAIIADEALLSQLRAEAAQARGRGVRGVPFFLFNDGTSLSGAQAEPAMLDAIQSAGRAPR